MMKQFTKNLKQLFFAIILIGLQQDIIAQCTSNFTFTYNANGNVSFTSLSSPSTNVGRSWWFGNNQSSSQGNPNTTYTANGVYTVCLNIWTPSVAPTCSATICQTINVTNAVTPTCVLNASYVQTVSANSATFQSNSTGTVVGSTYSWDYGDATTGSGITSTHNYAGPGNYNVKLVVNNGSGCVDSSITSVFVNGPCNIVANFTANQLGNGNVQFVSTSTGTTAITQYYWYKNATFFGSGNPITSNFPNGTYTISLMAVNQNTFCQSTFSQVIVVTSNTCFLTASFTSTTSATAGTFASTSTGTVVGSTYTWNYGDSNSGVGNPTTHTYASPNWYNVGLVVNNGNGCIDSVYNWVTVAPPCTLVANFTANQLGGGNVQFVSTSTGTTANTWYDWYKNGNYANSGDPVTMYFTNGTYTITLEATDSWTPNVCVDTVSYVITVTSNTCNLAANFAYTVGANGLVNFQSTSTGTVTGMTYAWDFGNGFNTVGGPTTSHTYTNAGIYNVSLVIQDPNNPNCKDSVSIPVNVNTAPCIANANFTMTQITTGWWNATPQNPWNVVWAQWSWGDNTTSNTLYTSHTYSPTGIYNICLTVSVSCGATATSCVTYTITRTSTPISMAYINVIPPQSTTIGLKKQTMLTDNLMVYPNPSNGKFEIKLVGFNEREARIKIYSVAGALIYESKGNIENGNLNHEVKLNGSPGIYFVKIESDSGVITKKLILKD
jgi:PKD repeat protein